MKVVVLTNILTPYRKFFFDTLSKELVRRGSALRVLVLSESEPNRSWRYEELCRPYTTLLCSREVTLFGAYVHLNSGIRDVLMDLNPDIVVCAGSYLEPSVWQVLRARKRIHAPVIFWSESHLSESKESRGIKLAIREMIRKRIYPAFDGFWVPGLLASRLVAKYVGAPNLAFVPNLVDSELYTRDEADKAAAYRASLGISEHAVMLFTPARLTPAKGIIEFLELLSKRASTVPYVYVLAGDGELEGVIRDYVRKHNMDVRLLGYKDQTEMILLYQASDVFVMPSKSDPNPLSCVEASWSKKPLLVSNHVGNYPELVKQGVNGWVFSYEDSYAATRIIDTVLSMSRSELENAGRASRAIAKRDFSPRVIAPRVADWLEVAAEHSVW